jgi:epoxide hydrolase-like predicted phosphatase
MRRPVLIFDFGNVVAFFDFQKAYSVLESRSGLTREVLASRLRDNGFHALMERYESGGMGSSEFSREVCELGGVDLSHEEFVTAWNSIFTLNEPIAELVRMLKARGYRLLLGSNTNELHADHFLREYAETMAHFDHLVLSYQVGHIKPSVEFYRACARLAEVEPSECIFIDDRPENVEGARQAGLTAILFDHVDGLLPELRRLGVEH